MGKSSTLAIAIAGGYQKLQNWNADSYLTILDYRENFDSTLHPALQHPVINEDWQIDFIKFVSLDCPDKQYGFKVLTGADNWVDFCHPKDPMTQIHSWLITSLLILLDMILK